MKCQRCFISQQWGGDTWYLIKGHYQTDLLAVHLSSCSGRRQRTHARKINSKIKLCFTLIMRPFGPNYYKWERPFWALTSCRCCRGPAAAAHSCTPQSYHCFCRYGELSALWPWRLSGQSRTGGASFICLGTVCVCVCSWCSYFGDIVWKSTVVVETDLD